VSPTRTPTEEEVALADSLFGMFRLFKAVVGRATHTVEQSSPERARLLFSLKAGACRAGFLASEAKISPSTITEVVEGLEEDGLVRREPDPDDRRAVRVALTAEGRRHLQRFEQSMALALADILQELTPSQRHRIRAAFNDLREVILSKSFTEPSRPEATLRQSRHKEATIAR
jgi:DNA-binding MarR family transcriptional regulator